MSVILQLGVSEENGLYDTHSAPQEFLIYPGFSRLTILMEGIYTETTSSGERILCLVGSTKIPDLGKNLTQPFDWLPLILRNSTLSPPVIEESHIRAIVRYLKDLRLKSRARIGRFESTRDSPESGRFFDPVTISSRLGAYSNYEFGSADSKDLISSSCESGKGPMQVPDKVCRGSSFCTVLQEILTRRWVDIMPNRNCPLYERSDSDSRKFGPFPLPRDGDQGFMDGRTDGPQLLVQDIRCAEGEEGEKSSRNKNLVSAVFRVVLPSQSRNLAFERTSLDVAEGHWNAASGELCMVGCTPDDDNGPKCETLIRMNIPLSLSLKQRTILEGTISGLSSLVSPSSDDQFCPLSFRLPVYPIRLLDVMSNISYEYAEMKEAGVTIAERIYELTGLREQIKKSMLEYPGSDGNLVDLFMDLSFTSSAFTNPTTLKGPHLKKYVELHIMAIQDHVKIDWWESWHNIPYPQDKSSSEEKKDDSVDEPTYYNIAAEFKLRYTPYDDNGGYTISAEGLYDPASGRIFLVGCRELRMPWRALQHNAELLEPNGLDCQIELRVEYLPTNARWLMNSSVMITLTSKRPTDDPFYFSVVELETFPILHKKQREEIVSRKSLEGVLSLLALSLLLWCIVRQLHYVKTHSESTPYVSLLMLMVQAAGLSTPLLTGMEAWYARTTSDQADIGSESVIIEARVINYMVMLLTLATLLRTLRIMGKVYKSRLRLQSTRPLETWRVASDKKLVLSICLGGHILGFLMVLVIHSMRMSNPPASSSSYRDWKSELDWSTLNGVGELDGKTQLVEGILKKYYGSVHDLFLLPQVVGNHIWVVRGKPLRSIFYAGITLLRILPHIYDALRPLAFEPYFSDEFEYVNPSSDFYSKAWDIVISLFAGDRGVYSTNWAKTGLCFEARLEPGHDV